jgi:hypothetical protein
MIWIFIIMISFGTAWADGGCLREQQLNKAIASELKIPCEEFPQIVPIEELSVSLTQDLVLTSVDVDRLAILEELSFQGSDSTFHSIKLQGDIKFPALKDFEAYDVIKSIDTTQGKFIFNKIEEFHTVFFEGLRELLASGIFAKSTLGINAEAGVPLDLDFKGLSFNHSIEINGARSIRNLVITEGVRYLTIYGPHDSSTSVSNLVYTSGMSLRLRNIKFEDFHSPFRLYDGYMLELENIHVEKPLITNDSSLTSLSVINSDIVIPSAEVFSKVHYYKIEGSTVVGGVVPTKNPKIQSFEIIKSTVTIESFPLSKVMYRAMISGSVTILDISSPLFISKGLRAITIAVPGLREVSFVIEQPENLEGLTVLDSPEVQINFHNIEYSPLLPKFLKILVDKKKKALELRKILKLKSVGFISE